MGKHRSSTCPGAITSSPGTPAPSRGAPGSTLPAGMGRSRLAKQEPDPAPALSTGLISRQPPQLLACWGEIGAACKGARRHRWPHALHGTRVLLPSTRWERGGCPNAAKQGRIQPHIPQTWVVLYLQKTGPREGGCARSVREREQPWELCTGPVSLDEHQEGSTRLLNHTQHVRMHKNAVLQRSCPLLIKPLPSRAQQMPECLHRRAALHRPCSPRC